MSFDLPTLRAHKSIARQDYEKQVLGDAARSGGGGGFGDAGPPSWNRASWEGFKGQYGFYPFGRQNGTMVRPPTMDGAPDWVYELMGERKPPITVRPV